MPAPSGYHNDHPFALIVRDGKAAVAIAFYQKAPLAPSVRRHVMDTPEGKIMHAEILTFGDSVGHAFGDEFPGLGFAFSPQTIGGSPCIVVAASTWTMSMRCSLQARGGRERRWCFPVTDQFWGDRMGKSKDSFGHLWSVATRLDEVAGRASKKFPAERPGPRTDGARRRGLVRRPEHQKATALRAGPLHVPVTDGLNPAVNSRDRFGEPSLPG